MCQKWTYITSAVEWWQTYQWVWHWMQWVWHAVGVALGAVGVAFDVVMSTCTMALEDGGTVVVSLA